MELEHVVGYTGSFAQTVVCHPTNANTVIYAMGAVVMIQDTRDAHAQTYLRGHDAEVCCIAVAADGSRIASGQIASTEHPGDDAPVVVWDAESRANVFVLEGLHERVLQLAFSPDGRFLAATGALGMLFVWDMQTGEVVCGRKFDGPVSLFAWGPVVGGGRRPKYTFCSARGAEVFGGELAYDLRSLMYTMTESACQRPSAGLYRAYTAGAFDATQRFLLAGNQSGEIGVYGFESRVFRRSLTVASNGVTSLLTLAAEGGVLVGGGDGSVRKLIGADTEWRVVGEAQLDGAVHSLSRGPDGACIAATSSGAMYSLDTASLAASLLSASHTAGVTAVAFGARSDLVASASRDGSVRVWDLSDYRVVATARPRSVGAGGATVLAFTANGELISGWDDLSLRAHDSATGEEKWSVPNVHHVAITALAATDRFLVTGGAEGLMRVWSRAGRTEVVIEFKEHRKAVTDVIVDNEEEHIVHSAGADHALMTYNLKRSRRTVSKMARDGAFTALTQRKDSERELATACADGRVLFWDVDYDEPVMPVLDAEHTRINAISMSPSGRYVAVACEDHQIKVLDVLLARVVAVGFGHSAAVTTLKWSPDEKQIVSGSSDCSLCVWNWYGFDNDDTA